MESDKKKLIGIFGVWLFIGLWGSSGSYLGGVEVGNSWGLPGDVVSVVVCGILLVGLSLFEEIYWKFKNDEFASFWFRLEEIGP